MGIDVNNLLYAAKQDIADCIEFSYKQKFINQALYDLLIQILEHYKYGD